jgi:hypothetical protein
MKMNNELSLIVFEAEDGNISARLMSGSKEANEVYDNCYKTEDGSKPRMTLITVNYDGEINVDAKSKILDGKTPSGETETKLGDDK